MSKLPEESEPITAFAEVPVGAVPAGKVMELVEPPAATAKASCTVSVLAVVTPSSTALEVVDVVAEVALGRYPVVCPLSPPPPPPPPLTGAQLNVDPEICTSHHTPVPPPEVQLLLSDTNTAFALGTIVPGAGNVANV